jgi:hypothetical protein
LLEVEVAHAGKQVQCPMCQTIMRIPELPRARPAATARAPAPAPARQAPQARPEPEAEEEEVEEQPRPKKSGTRAGLARVRVGVTYQLVQLYVKIIGSILLSVLIIVTVLNQAAAVIKAQGKAVDVQGFGLVGFVGIALSLATMILGILCCIYILGVPDRARAKGLAIAYVVCEISGSACGILGHLVSGLGLASILSLLNSLLGLGALVCFILFSKRLCEFIRRRSLAGDATTLLGLLGVLAMGYFLLFLSSFVPILAILSWIGGLILLVVGIWFLFRYARFLHDVRSAL